LAALGTVATLVSAIVCLFLCEIHSYALVDPRWE
jgi:hypothetical protein